MKASFDMSAAALRVGRTGEGARPHMVRGGGL
jgi:hypothetical protein